MSSTTTIHDEIHAYVHGVRQALADLPTDDVDELTLGMEADLAEIRAEGGTLVDRLGTPAVYAAELRSAAGLPARTRFEPLRSDLRSRVRTAMARHPWLHDVRAYVVMLRPAWWALRGFLATWVVVAMSGAGLVLGLPLLALFTVLSVRLGLHGLSARPHRLLLGASNAVAAVAALFFAAATVTHFFGDPPWNPNPASYEASATPGLAYNGSSIANVFVYDAAGHRVPQARLYGADGAELRLDNGTAWPQTGTGRAPVDAYGHRYENTVPVHDREYDPWNPPADPMVAPGDDMWRPPAILPPLVPTTPAAPSGVPTASSTPSTAITPTTVTPTTVTPTGSATATPWATTTAPGTSPSPAHPTATAHPSAPMSTTSAVTAH